MNSKIFLMETKPKIAITGALGYSGKYVTELLLSKGHKVKTLTNSPKNFNPFENQIEISPLCFSNPAALTESLKGYDILINTYWVRFNHKNFTHTEAVMNTKILFDCAKKAGIKRIVHVSITNPSITSDLDYFRGKADLENYLKLSGVDFSIIRPAVLFGKEDILINNIAWMIRHLPVFGVFGKGEYQLQPIYVEDFAGLIVRECENDKNEIVNAIGPESFSYKELVTTLMAIIKVRKIIFNVHPFLGYLCGKLISIIKDDVTITKEEIKGLMDNLLFVDSPPTGTTKLTDWAKQNSQTLGVKYANELSRRRLIQ